jgi:hypothetical protein
MMRSALYLVVAASALCWLAAGCGGSDDDATSSASPSPTPTGGVDLSKLVLLDTSVTIDGVPLTLDTGATGPRTKGQVVDAGLDTAWVTDWVEKYKWQAEYAQDYGIGNEGPVFDASVYLDLFDTPEDAQSALDDRFAHARTWEGQVFKDTTVEAVDVFDPGELHATAVSLTLVQVGTTAHLLNVDFVRGSILVDIGTASVDERDLFPATMNLVRRVDQRLTAQGVP